MTEKEHRKRHNELHKALDELFADFVAHSGIKAGIELGFTRFTRRPIIDLIEWSYKQSTKPDHTDD